jgi:hypothetical protein
MSRIVLKSSNPNLVPVPNTGKFSYFCNNEGRIFLKNNSNQTKGFAFIDEANRVTTFDNISEFPSIGELNNLYIDLNNSELYFWDINTNSYKNVAGSASLNSYIRNSFSERFQENFDTTTIVEALDKIIFPYTPQIVELNTTTNLLNEKGINVINIDLNGNIIKKTNDIISAIYYKDSSIIHSIIPTPVSGGSIPFVYPLNINDTSLFELKVNDSVSLITKEILIEFIYPILYGSNDQSLNATQIGTLLQRRIAKKSSEEFLISSSESVIYFAYLSSYGYLTKIIEIGSGLNIIDAFDTRTENLLLLDSSIQEYIVYELKMPTTISGNYKIEF